MSRGSRPENSGRLMHIKSARFDEALEHRGDLRARVAVSCGARTPSDTPSIMPFPTAQAMASAAHELMEAASSKPSSSAVPLAQPSA